MIQLNDRSESIDLITLKAEIEKSNNMVERKKPGLKKARKASQFSKR